VSEQSTADVSEHARILVDHQHVQAAVLTV
jgi:hypothetical protein